MQSTSATWKALAATGNAVLKTRATIDGTVYEQISTPIIKRGIMQGGLSVGNAVAASCEFSLRPVPSDASVAGMFTAGTRTVTASIDDYIPRSAQVVIEMQYTDGTSTSAWYPAGTFFVAHREVDPVTEVISLECYDALMKANAEYEYGLPWTDHNNNLITDHNGTSIYFAPITVRMIDAVNNIAALIGVTLDSRTTIQTGNHFKITIDSNGATMRDVLGAIAAAHGGNWIITPENKLRLVPLNSAANASSATSNVVAVTAVLGGISVGTTNTITGVRITDTERVETLLGTDTGLVVDISAVAGIGYSTSYLSSALIGKTYQAYSLSGAIYDPAVEIGDYINLTGNVHSVICEETVRLGIACRGDVSAPEPGEISDEFPYISPKIRQAQLQEQYADRAAQNALDAANTNIQAASAQATQQIQQTNQAIQNLDNSLTQQEIFDRLTDGGLEQGLSLDANVQSLGAAGDKKLYLNMDYARYGKLIADFIQGGTLTLGGLDNANGVLNILDASGNVIGTWTKDGITITKGSITGTNNNSWDISGTGQIVAKTGSIGNFTLGNGKLSYQNSNTDTAELSVAGLSYSKWYTDTTFPNRGYRKGASLTDHGVDFTINDAQESTGQIWFYGNSIYDGTPITNNYFESAAIAMRIMTRDGQWHPMMYMRAVTDEDQGFDTYSDVTVETDAIMGENCYVWGDLTVDGTKSRKVETDQYSDRLLYCYETPSPLFGDVGEGVIADDGKCYVWLDPVFANTISTDQYQVFLQKYGDGDCWVAERRPGYFVVAGTAGLAFGWELKAKQKDYDQKRLDSPNNQFTPATFNYGAYAAQHIEDLQKARESA